MSIYVAGLTLLGIGALSGSTREDSDDTRYHTNRNPYSGGSTRQRPLARRPRPSAWVDSGDRLPVREYSRGVRTRVGYAGGTLANPTYYNLGDHTETIEMDYDPDVITYTELLAIFWNSHDPTSPSYSRHYKSIIF